FFDGHHLELEDEFAFSLCRTRAEWEAQQEDYRRFSEEMDRKAQERPALAEDETASAWSSSFVDLDQSPLSPLVGLSFLLAELGSDLRERPGGLALLRDLTDRYRQLRTSEDAVASASAAEDLRDGLELMTQQFPDLTAKAADLQSRLDEALRRVKGARR